MEASDGKWRNSKSGAAGKRGWRVGSSYKERIEWKEKRDKEARTERREGCLLADQSIGKYRHRGESRRRETRRGGEGGERGRQGKRYLRKMKNTREHKEGKERDRAKKDIGDNGRRGRVTDA